MATALKTWFLLLLAACSSEGPPNAPEVPSEQPKATEVLPPYQAQRPHQQAVLNLGTMTLYQGNDTLVREGSINFVLDDRYPLEGAKLKLHDLWYSAEVWLGDTFIGTVDGGSFPAEIELPDRLRPGPQRLALRVKAPGQKSGFLLGSRKEVDFNKASVGEIELHLAPAIHIEWFALPLQQGLIHPKAFVSGAHEGSRVRLQAYLDGALIQDLGEAPVENGYATLSPVEWQGALWDASTGSSALYQFVATLLDKDGNQQDQRTRRSGVRELGHSGEGLTVNGKNTRLVALRMEENWHRSDFNLNEILQAGVNSIEIHGAYPSKSWMELSDETGIQLVILPRCDGEVKATSHDVKTQKEKVLQQHKAIALATLHHPSLMFWTTEGAPGVMRKLAESFNNDPLGRPVTGGDIPAVALSGRDPAFLSRVQAGSWITEITSAPGGGPADSIRILRESIGKGAMGGVLPAIQNHVSMRELWLEQVGVLTQELDTPRVRMQAQRSMSQVAVQGHQLTSPVWLEAPFTMPTGVLRASSGYAVLSTFYAGEAQLVQGDHEIAVTLTPNERHGGGINKKNLRVQWPKP